MGQGKRAWIYCAIDAPEDRNGALKSQFKQLIDYGEQMDLNWLEVPVMWGQLRFGIEMDFVIL